MKRKIRRIMETCCLVLLCAGLTMSGGCEWPDLSPASVASALSRQVTVSDSWDAAGSQTHDGRLTAVFLDVGQADAALLTLPNGRHMLIDGGNNNDGTLICDYLQEQGIDTIDYLIATHPHEDHIGGLDTVIEELEIGSIYAPRLADDDIPTTRTYEDFLEAISDKGYKLHGAKAGDYLLKEEDVAVQVLSPAVESYEELNNYSVVLRITYGRTSMLLAGDAETLCEEEMLDEGYELQSDLLKVGHHGSHSSSSADFIEAVAPSYAVISCGEDNTYGHPHAETLETLEAAGAQVFRTDMQGTILAVSDGQTLTLSADQSICCDGGR